MEKSIGHYIKILSMKFEKSMNSILLGMGLTLQQMEVLLFIFYKCNDSTTQNVIEKEFKIKNSTASGILLRLESKGFIIRKTFKEDSRYKIISTTYKAKEYIKSLKDKKNEVDNKLKRNFTDEEYENFIKYLERLNNNIADL